jgi:glycine betaine/proline transport system substrate-binding protein
MGEQFMSRFKSFAAGLGLAALLSTGAFAADPDSCKEVKFADVGWTDITATTATASVILEALGYAPDVQVLSVPVTYTSLKSKDIDVFLGNWMPTMEADIKPYLEDKSVETIKMNLDGAKYTLAVPKYTFDAGLKSFEDIAKFKDKLGNKIYGIEAGNDGNRLILDMITANKFGLEGFELVESSEAGMLSAVQKAAGSKEDVVFLPAATRCSARISAAPPCIPTCAPAMSRNAPTSASSSPTSSSRWRWRTRSWAQS